MLLIGPTCMLSMWFGMRDFRLSSCLIEALQSSVLSTRPYVAAQAFLGICLPHAILKVMVKLSVQIESLSTSCVSLFLLI